MAAFLSSEELVQLTGYKVAAYQIRWLAREGIRHWVNRSGRPVVPISAVDGRQTQEDDGGFQLGKVA